jgi:hypothetical protein
MDSDELALLEQGIRTLLTELRLDWVRSNIEQGITAGVHKEVVVGRSQQLDRPASLFDDEEGFQYAEPLSGKGGQRMIGNLRLGPADRMRLVIQALSRIIVELPAIQEETINRLASTRYLNRQKIARELHAVPGAPEIEGVQSLIREAFKAHVGRSDSDLRI